jgi:hypothetical protein
MLYPLSYERSHCSILHPERSLRVLTARARAHSDARASDSQILNGLNLDGHERVCGLHTTRKVDTCGGEPLSDSLYSSSVMKSRCRTAHSWHRSNAP